MNSAALQVDNLSFAYADGVQALDGITFSVAIGESMGIIGPNGAGKSTLLLHLNGLLRGQGIVTVLGLEISLKVLPAIRSRVGLVFQDPNDQLFMPTIRDDVAFGPLNLDWDQKDVEAKTAASLRQLELEEQADRPAARLSLGERKRAALATVLVLEPQILVLDEPTSGLDPGCRRRLIATIQNIPQTKIIASHDLDLVWETCHRVLLLDRGRIVTSGSTEEILSDQPLLEAHSLEVPLTCLLHRRWGWGRIT